MIRHLEVQLDGAALPGTAERILQMEVDLGAVEGAVALVDLVVHSKLARGQSRRPCSARCPVLVRAHGVIGARGELQRDT